MNLNISHTEKLLQKSVEKQLSILEKILDTEKEKYSILLSGKLSDLSDINQILLDQVEGLEESERQRIQQIETLIQNHPRLVEKHDHLSFEYILDSIRFTSSSYESMKRIHDQSLRVISRIKYYTSLNQDLIENILDIISMTLQQGNKEIDFTNQIRANPAVFLNKKA